MGAEVARLLDDGLPAGEIAIVLRDPRSAGPLYRRVLMRFGIPVAVQADLAATRTTTGAGLIALLRAAVGGGGASDLLAYLRTPGRRLAFEDRLVRAEAAARPAADDATRRSRPGGPRARTATRGCARSRSSARRVREPRSCARPASRLAGSPSRPCAIRAPLPARTGRLSCGREPRSSGPSPSSPSWPPPHP